MLMQITTLLASTSTGCTNNLARKDLGVNLISVLLSLLVVFGGRNSTKNEISTVLSVIVNVANVLMEELHIREKRSANGDDTPSPFSPANWDVLSSLVEGSSPAALPKKRKAAKPRGKAKRKATLIN